MLSKSFDIQVFQIGDKYIAPFYYRLHVTSYRATADKIIVLKFKRAIKAALKENEISFENKSRFITVEIPGSISITKVLGYFRLNTEDAGLAALLSFTIKEIYDFVYPQSMDRLVEELSYIEKAHDRV